MTRSRRLPVLATLAGVLATSVAGAEGVTYNNGGTKALARGGAVVARIEDPMALHHNPAGLAALGHKQIYLSLDVPFYSACVEPIGYYGWGVYDPGVSEFGDSGDVAADADGNALPGQYATTELHEVCNTAGPQPIPELAFSWRLTDDVGIAFGFVGPAALGAQQWGGEDATISRDGKSFPTPTRYALVSQRIEFAINPTVGIGWQLDRMVRVGAAFQWLALDIESKTVQAQGAGTSPHNDSLATARAKDLFIPGATLGVHVTPIDELDLAAAFQWRDSFDGSGEVVYETNNYHVGTAAPGIPLVNDPLALDRVHQQLPWMLTVGARFAGRTEPREYGENGADRIKDPLATELWDVELDVNWAMTSRLSKTSVSVEDTCKTDANGRIPEGGSGNLHEGCQRLEFDFADASLDTILDVPPEGLSEFTVDRHYKDQIIVRLGSSYTILPNELAAHAGAYYETRGVDPDFASIDAMPFARVGVSVGGHLRLGRFDILAGYGHIFQETLTVGAPPHQNRDSAVAGNPKSGFDKRVGQPCSPLDVGCVEPVPLEEEDAPTDPDGVASYEQGSFIETPNAQHRPVNAGRYRAAFDVVSVGVSYHFD